MKKYIILIIIFISKNIIAQENEDLKFNKKDIFISGSLKYSNNHVGDFETIDNFTFNPKVGYFFNDKMNLGLQLNYEAYSRKTIGNQDKNKFLGFGIFYRNYFATISKRIYFFGESDLNYLFAIRKDNLSNYDSIWNFNISPGINFFINKNFIIESKINLLSYNIFNRKQLPSNSFNLNLDFNSINWGLIYKF